MSANTRYPQVLPAVDLSPLGLADLTEDAATASQSATQQQECMEQEQWLLLQPLLATGQLFSYLGVELGPGPGGQAGGEDAGPALRVLFELVAYGDQPLLPYQQAMLYYKQAAALGGDLAHPRHLVCAGPPAPSRWLERRTTADDNGPPAGWQLVSCHHCMLKNM